MTPAQTAIGSFKPLLWFVQAKPKTYHDRDTKTHTLWFNFNFLLFFVARDRASLIFFCNKQIQDDHGSKKNPIHEDYEVSTLGVIKKCNLQIFFFLVKTLPRIL